MRATRELRNLEKLHDARKQLASMEHMRSVAYNAPKLINVLDHEITRLRKRIRKLEK